MTVEKIPFFLINKLIFSEKEEVSLANEYKFYELDHHFPGPPPSTSPIKSILHSFSSIFLSRSCWFSISFLSDLLLFRGSFPLHLVYRT